MSYEHSTVTNAYAYAQYLKNMGSKKKKNFNL